MASDDASAKLMASLLPQQGDASQACPRCSCACFADTLLEISRRLESIDRKLPELGVDSFEQEPWLAGDFASGLSPGEPSAAELEEGRKARPNPTDYALIGGGNAGQVSRADVLQAGQLHAQRSSQEHLVCCDEPADSWLLSTRFQVRRMVNHPLFDSALFLIILTNSVFIGLDADGSAVNPNHDHDMFQRINLAFSGVFIAEFLVLLMAEGTCEYFRNIDGWRIFDLFIALESLSSVVLLALSVNQSTSQIRNIRLTRSLKAMKLLRVLRVGKILYFTLALRELVTGILSTVHLLGWATLLLALVVYIFATFFTSLYDLQDALTPELMELQPFFGSVGESSMTLVQTMFNGFSWRDVALPLRSVSVLYEFAFIMFVVITVLTVLNVVTGVFAAVAVSNSEHDPELIAMNVDKDRLRLDVLSKRLFALLDADHSGKITLKELESAWEKKGFKALLKLMNIDARDFWLLFAVLDSDSDGLLDFEELALGMHKLTGSGTSLEVSRLQLGQRVVLNKVISVEEQQKSDGRLLKQCSDAVSLAARGAGPWRPRRVSRQAAPAAGGSREQRPVQPENKLML